jgi:hypothetical protein
MTKVFPASIVAISAISGAILFQASPAQALPITVNGSQWDVTSFSGTYDDNQSKFALPPGGQMPWWGNEVLAEAFKQAYQNQPGAGFLDFGYSLGSFQMDAGGFFIDVPCVNSTQGCTTTNANRDWATASLYTPPLAPPQTSSVPGPVPLFGAVAAFGASRRLRQRSRGSRLQA